MCNVLASVAAYETEIRAERVSAGQAVARASGKTYNVEPYVSKRFIPAEEDD